MARTARPSVIAVMGHVDHGKSSLLDYIRKSNVVAGEAGGITQHVAAYIAEHNERHITFLDTPGHAAFKTLRERGAHAADIAILVVAADEGVMPQTEEALGAITEAKIPYVVAITKIDKNNADIERAKSSMLEHGIYLEGLGGDIPYAPISSKTGEGIPELLDLVLLASDLVELTCDTSATASGYVLEATQDPKRGIAATLIVKEGTLHVGSFVVAGGALAPVRFIEDFRGARVSAALPSEPARVAGWSALPQAGTIWRVVANKKEAELLVKKEVAHTVEREAVTEGIIELPLIIKADVAGSLDAIRHELSRVAHDRAAIHIIADGVGVVSENDVRVAQAAGGAIIAFNVSIEPIARDLADREHVLIEPFSIIYELTERVNELLATRAGSIEVEEEIGRAKVLKVFSAQGKKQVLGARLLSGSFAISERMKILRATEEIARGNVLNLQQARANVKEIRTEGEFGMEVEVREKIGSGDELVVFRLVEKS